MHKGGFYKLLSIDFFLFRADFRAEGGRSVSQSERKKMLVSFAEPQQR
jgi:hypothetical protein